MRDDHHRFRTASAPRRRLAVALRSTCQARSHRDRFAPLNELVGQTGVLVGDHGPGE